MRKAILATGLAAALATTSFAGTAMANGVSVNVWVGGGPYYSSGPYYPYYVHRYHQRHYYDYQRPYYPGYYGYYYDPGPAIVAGAIFGAIGGALVHRRYHHH
jgi:hypothetical protein